MMADAGLVDLGAAVLAAPMETRLDLLPDVLPLI
jgi:hypothetical protein